MKILQARDVGIVYGSIAAGPLLTFDIEPGEAVALVGSSGSGKTSLALALMGLLKSPGQMVGMAHLSGIDLHELRDGQWRHVRGGRIGMVTQDPTGWLDPVQRVDAQIAEGVRTHSSMPRRDSIPRAHELLSEVGLGRDKWRRYPHQLSGGERQRVSLAIALSGNPELLIADEPTSALDVATADDVIEVIQRRRRHHDLALLLITHDKRALDAIGPRLIHVDGEEDVAPGNPAPMQSQSSDESNVLLRAEGLSMAFGRTPVVKSFDLQVNQGETVALVGRSGAGKSTIARMVAGLLDPQGGSVHFDGANLYAIRHRKWRKLRSRIQFVAQNSYGVLNPHMTVTRLIAEPLHVHGMWRPNGSTKVSETLAAVGLSSDLANRKSGELSGGQRQRVAIARSLICAPEMLILDEPFSSLDRGARFDLQSLLLRLRDEYSLTCLLISHEAETVEAMAHRVVKLGPS